MHLLFLHEQRVKFAKRILSRCYRRVNLRSTTFNP